MWIVMFILLILSPIKSWASEYSTFVCEVSSTCWVPVYIVDSADKVSGKTGITDTALTVYYAKENAAAGTLLTDTKNCSTGNFCENDATNMAGFYWIKLVSSDVTASVGRWVIVLKASGMLDAPVHVTVVPDLDIPMADIPMILADTGTDGVLVSDGTGTGQINTNAGAVVSVTGVTNDVGITQAGADKVWSATATVSGTSIAIDAIVDKNWDEPKAGHTGTTTFGDLATDVDAVLDDTGTSGVVLANDAITPAKIQDGAITSSEAPNLDAAVSTRLASSAFPGDLKWANYQIIDLTNEGGDQNPTTTTSDTNSTQTLNFTATNPQPVMYYPTTGEETTQSASCNVQGMRTTITGYNTTTKVITYDTLPAAPDYRCVFRMY